MLKFSSPFEISTEVNKSMVKLPTRKQSNLLQFWSPSPLKSKTQADNNLNTTCNESQNKLKITNLSVDSISFGTQEFKAQKKPFKDISGKLKVTTWNLRKRESIIKRESTKPKVQLVKCFSLKSRQATIHSVHPPAELRYSANSWKQTVMDRSIESLTMELRELFNLRRLKTPQNNSSQESKELGGNKTNFISVKKCGSASKQKESKSVSLALKQKTKTKKEVKSRQNEWFPWNCNSKRKVQKESESPQIVSQWYDRNFSITLN